MSMTEIFYNLGKHDASMLRNEAKDLTETQIIAREMSIPAFNPQKDYSSWPVAAPVTDEGQVWVLIQPHNAAHYEGRPATLRALWSLCHSKDPAHVKAWVDPYGTSGMYMKDECYIDEFGQIWKCLIDNTVYPAAAYAAAWEKVNEGGEQ